MVLVDTSIWIDHLRQRDDALAGLLANGAVLIHPAIIVELALGNLRNSAAVLDALKHLPKVQAATEREVLDLVAARDLAGSGIGYADAHLIAAVLLTPGSRLWTRDRRLGAVAQRLGFAFAPAN